MDRDTKLGIEDVILKRPFFLDLVNSFLDRPGMPGPIEISSLTTESVLNLLAPAMCGEFSLTDITERAEALRSNHGSSPNKGRPPDYQSASTVARRGRPKRVHSNQPIRVREPTDGPSTETNLRQLIHQFGETQEENLTAASDILRTREIIMGEFSHILTDLDLDNLVGIARHPAKQHTLKDATDQLFRTTKNSFAHKRL